MSDEAVGAFAAALRSGPDDAALVARDEALAAGVDVVPVLADGLTDRAIRERAAWLAKDLCDARLWPALRDALREEPSAAVLDALERYAFAEVLPADAASELLSSIPLSAELRRSGIALLVALGSDEAIARLQSIIGSTSLSTRERDLLVGSPDPRVRALVDDTATTARMRAQESLERGESLPDQVVEELARAETWSVLVRAAEAGALSDEARARLATWPEPEGASKSQRRLLRRLRDLLR